MCFGFGALKKALRCPLVATVSVECRSTNGWRLRRKQKDAPFQSLVFKLPFTAPPDLYHLNETSRKKSGTFLATQWVFGSQAPEACDEAPPSPKEAVKPPTPKAAASLKLVSSRTAT
jgi:hypothetical protein